MAQLGSSDIQGWDDRGSRLYVQNQVFETLFSLGRISLYLRPFPFLFPFGFSLPPEGYFQGKGRFFVDSTTARSVSLSGRICFRNLRDCIVDR